MNPEEGIDTYKTHGRRVAQGGLTDEPAQWVLFSQASVSTDAVLLKCGPLASGSRRPGKGIDTDNKTPGVSKTPGVCGMPPPYTVASHSQSAQARPLLDENLPQRLTIHPLIR